MFGGEGGIRFSAEKPGRGSVSPPDCHSLPLPFESHPLDSQNNKSTHLRGCFCVWRRRRDTLRYLLFRPLRAVPEKAALLETSQSAKPNAALRLLRRTLCSGSNPFPKYPTKQQKHPLMWMLLLFGGEGGIRTLEPLLTVTRFPIVRARPATRLLQKCCHTVNAN